MNTPTLSIYHPNARGTGCAIKLALVKPTPIEGSDEFTDGRFELTIAAKETAGKFPTFDWDNSLTIRLGFVDVSNMLTVFRGYAESIGDGGGLYISRPQDEAVSLRLRHIIEPMNGYCIDATWFINSAETKTYCIVLSPAEAMGLSIAMEVSLGKTTFGV